MPRAIGAALLLFASVTASAGEGCSSVDGTYFNAADSGKAFLDDLVRDPRGGQDKRLMVYGPTVGNRTEKKRFASTVSIAYDGKVMQLEFFDATGKPIVRYPADWPYQWTCKGSQFEWEYEGVSGVGNDIRETRTHTVLKREPSGDLQMVEETHDSTKKTPSRAEHRFRAAPAPR